MKRITRFLASLMVMFALMFSSGATHAATWDIFSYNDGLSIDDAGISPTTGFPYGETSWIIRYGSSPTNLFNPMFREWLWYRIGDVTPEASFSTLPASGVYNADTSAVTLTFDDTQVPARFRALVTFGVTGKPTYSYNSTTKKSITIQNLTAAPLDYHLFSYSDLDISPGGTMDNIAIVRGDRVLQTGFTAAGAPLGRTLIQTSTIKPSAYSMDTLSSNPGSLLDSLDKTGPTQLWNDGGPYFQNEDMQFAFQYDLTIPANGSVTFDITNQMVVTKPITLTYSQAGASCGTYGQNATYQVCAVNTTNTVAANNVVITQSLVDPDLLESRLAFLSATDGGVYDASTNTVTWNVPSLAVGATKCVQATVKVNSTTAYGTSATVFSDETFPSQAAVATNLCNYPPNVTSTPPASALTGVPYSYQITATDTENNPLTYTLATYPAGMTMSPTGLIQWTPSVDQQNTSQLVVVDINDGYSTIQYTFSVAVKWQNMAPTAPAMQTASAVANQLLAYQVVADDPDKQPLTFTTADPLPGGLTLSSTGLLSGTPTVSGQYVVNVKVTDPSNAFVMTAVVVNVSAAVIQPPVVDIIPNASIIAPAAFSYSVVATDPQALPLSYTLSSTPAASGLVINASTGVISWPTSVAGTYSITVTVSNTGGKSSSRSFTLTVAVPVLPPTITPIPSATISAPASFSYPVVASDPQGQSLTYSLPGAPSGMTISTAGIINWPVSVAGKYILTVRATNTSGLYAETSFTLTVNSTKITPTVTWNPPAAITYGTALSATQLNASASVPGSFAYTPAAGAVLAAGSQTLSVVFTPTDSLTYSSVTKTVTLTVNKANQSIGAVSFAPATVAVGGTSVVSASATSGLAVTFTSSTPTICSVSGTTVTGVAAGTCTVLANQSGNANFNAAAQVSSSIPVTSAGTNQAPVITSSPITKAYKDGYYYYQVKASDPNGDALSYSLSSRPSGMTINSSTGLVYWRAEDTGSYSVTIVVSDPKGLKTTQSYKIKVEEKPSNSSPQFTSRPITSASVGVPYSYAAKASDSNGDTVYYRLASGPSGMRVDLLSGMVTWTPQVSQGGSSHYVSIEAVDSKGGRTTQSYRIYMGYAGALWRGAAGF